MTDSRPPGLFGARNPRFYFVGQVVSQVGTNMQIVALGWFTYQLSRDELVLGIVTAAPILTMLLIGPVGGLVADRFPARRVLLCTHALLALFALALGLLAEHGSIAVWQLIVSALCVGAVNAIGLPTAQVFVSEIAGDAMLRQAVTLNNVILDLSLIVGSAAVGPVMAMMGLGGVILLNAASYLTVVVALLLVRPAELHTRRQAPKDRTQLWRAWVYLWARPGLALLIVIIATVGVFGTSLPSLLLLLTSSELNEEAGAYGVLLAVISVGSLLGAWMMWRAKVVLGTVLAGSVLLGVLEIVTSVMPTVVTLGLVLLPLGMVSLVLRAGLLSLAQLQTRPDYRGRVMAIFQLVYRSGWLLGTLLTSWLAGVLGPRPVIGLGGAGVTLGVALIIMIMVTFGVMSVSFTAARPPRLHVELPQPPEGRHRRRPRHAIAD
ncbi:MFS transporter [Streptomyces sp. NPDC019937]|uniref:MFS transporter n=1 Tax=Streptomyces sp. NPDC019937 TaxID=3154787 RepID=UPI00340520A9